MRNFFIFGGKDSRDYGVYITGTGVYNAPLKSYDTITVPGRSGDLVMANHRFENTELTYPAFIYANFKMAISQFKSAMLSADGYQRLEDSYNTDEYRKALYAGEMEVEARQQQDAGSFEIVFNCDPRRFLKIGENVQTISSGGSISNPTLFPSKPLIKVTGYGTLYVGGQQIVISQHFTSVNIDCEMMDCYSGTSNANSYVTMQGNYFPELPPGNTGITYSGNITKVEITPRWWRV